MFSGMLMLTDMVLKSPSMKFLKGVRKLMAELWMNSFSALPNSFSVSPHLMRVLPATHQRTRGHSSQPTHIRNSCQLNIKYTVYGAFKEFINSHTSQFFQPTYIIIYKRHVMLQNISIWNKAVLSIRQRILNKKMYHGFKKNSKQFSTSIITKNIFG